jgi:sec-independent protein translocase protein TatB
MFDISWSELLILGIVTLVFVGPKELPVFLRTLGRYAGTVRRHANEFKAQFDAAMREAELDSMRKEVAEMQSSINSEVMKAKSSISDAGAAAKLEAAKIEAKIEEPHAPAGPGEPSPSAQVAAAEPTADVPTEKSTSEKIPAPAERSPVERTES